MSNSVQGGGNKKNNAKKKHQWTPGKQGSEKSGVPKLKYGSGNFHVFKEALSTECLVKYGNMGRLIELEKYHELVKPNKTETRFTSGDPDDNKLLYMEALKAWAKKIEDAEVKKPMIYGLI